MRAHPTVLFDLRELLAARTLAEEHLRVMLARLEATNVELARALVQKALPVPEPNIQPVTPKRVTWWAAWRKG